MEDFYLHTNGTATSKIQDWYKYNEIMIMLYRFLGRCVRDNYEQLIITKKVFLARKTGGEERKYDIADHEKRCDAAKAKGIYEEKGFISFRDAWHLIYAHDERVRDHFKLSKETPTGLTYQITPMTHEDFDYSLGYPFIASLAKRDKTIDPSTKNGQTIIWLTFNEIRHAAWQFDFEWMRRGAPFVTIPPPEELVKLIDYILDIQAHSPNPSQSFPSVKMCESWKVRIREQLTSIYQDGRKMAHKTWEAENKEERQHLITATIDEVIRLGRDKTPKVFDENQAEWFLQGFCGEWWTIMLNR